jgi:hypothetical protein
MGAMTLTVIPPRVGRVAKFEPKALAKLRSLNVRGRWIVPHPGLLGLADARQARRPPRVGRDESGASGRPLHYAARGPLPRRRKKRRLKAMRLAPSPRHLVVGKERLPLVIELGDPMTQ